MIIKDFLFFGLNLSGTFNPRTLGARTLHMYSAHGDLTVSARVRGEGGHEDVGVAGARVVTFCYAISGSADMYAGVELEATAQCYAHRCLCPCII